MSEILLRPWQRGIPQSSEQITYHLSVVRPTLEIVQHTLRYLIKARATEVMIHCSLIVNRILNVFCIDKH